MTAGSQRSCAALAASYTSAMSSAPPDAVTRHAGAAVPPELAWVTHLGAARLVAGVYQLNAAFAAIFGFPILLLLGFLAGAMVQGPLHLSNAVAAVPIAVITAAACAVFGYWLGTKSARTVVLFDDGLAVREADRSRAWRWEDISAISVRRVHKHMDVPHEMTALYYGTMLVGRMFSRKVKVAAPSWLEQTLVLNDVAGASCSIDAWFPRVGELTDAIRSAVTPRVRPALVAAYESGADVSFGPVSVNRAGGLRLDKRTIGWSDLAELTFKKGYLVARGPTGGATRIPLGSILNLDVLIELLEYGYDRAMVIQEPTE